MWCLICGDATQGVNRCCRSLPSANQFRAIHCQIHWQRRSAQALVGRSGDRDGHVPCPSYVPAGPVLRPGRPWRTVPADAYPNGAPHPTGSPARRCGHRAPRRHRPTRRSSPPAPRSSPPPSIVYTTARSVVDTHTPRDSAAKQVRSTLSRTSPNLGAATSVMLSSPCRVHVCAVGHEGSCALGEEGVAVHVE